MCLMSVKEEEAPVPARVTRVRRVVRRSPSPPREVRVTRQSFGEERRPSPPTPPQPEPPRSSVTIHTEQRSEQRHVSRPPSSAAPSRSAQTHFVEVDHDSSSSSEDDVRSRTTRKSSRSKSSRSKGPRTEVPASEYSMHEREIRRERGYSNPRPRQPEYETYRYVEAPKNRSGSRSRYHEGSRASRDSFRREDDYGRRYHR